MNQLETTIHNQYRRVETCNGDPTIILGDAKGEIMAVATPELTEEIIQSSGDSGSALHRTSQSRTVASRLAELGVLVPSQGYVGGVLRQGDELLICGHSLAGGIKPDDLIQQEMGEVFYPPMMWAKALRSVAYNNRPESARELSAAEYLAKLGLTLGSTLTENGDVLGATGFLPGPRLQELSNIPIIGTHMEAEPTEVFRLSGLSDQAAVDPSLQYDTERFCQRIIDLEGNLN